VRRTLDLEASIVIASGHGTTKLIVALDTWSALGTGAAYRGVHSSLCTKPEIAGPGVWQNNPNLPPVE
jgi:hypothetical protein